MNLHTKQWCKNISKALTGKKQTKEHKENNSLSHIGLKQSNQTKEKKRLSMKKYFKIHNVWSIGLTKETDERIKKMGLNVSKVNIGNQNLIIAQKKNAKKRIETRKKKGWYKNPEQARKNLSKANLDKWKNLKFREKNIKAILKGLMKRPTSFEQPIIDLIKKYNLPFKYVGDGQVIIAYKNPDFIQTNGKKLIIETYAKWCHPKNYEEVRSKRFVKYGYRTLFLDDSDLLRKDCEEHCLNKIVEFNNEYK